MCVRVKIFTLPGPFEMSHFRDDFFILSEKQCQCNPQAKSDEEVNSFNISRSSLKLQTRLKS